MYNTNSRYRWYILTLSMLTHGTIAGLLRLCMPVLFKQISEDLGLNLTEIGAIWGMDPLAGVFIGLPAGLIADRFGIRRTLVVVCILAGIFSALRGFSINFITLATAMFLFGFVAAALPSIIPKTTTQWFSKQQLGLTNALINVSFGVGAMTATMFSATVFSPFLGSWKNLMFVYGAPPVILGFLWLFTAREPDAKEPESYIENVLPFRQALSEVVHIKEVWFIGLISMAFWGASMGYNGYLPLYLRNIGWTPVYADSVITGLMGVTALGTIPMVLLSNRLKSRKAVLFMSILTMVINLALLPFANGAAVWALVIIGGFIRAGTSALFNIIIFEIKGLG
ncbi:MFS transporter, partial [Chloroflexota bacterium]